MKRFLLLLIAVISTSGCIHREMLCPTSRCGEPAWNVQAHATVLGTGSPPDDPLGRSGSERATAYIVRTLRHMKLTPRRAGDDILLTLPGTSSDGPPILLVGSHGTSSLSALQTLCEGREDSIGIALLLETARALTVQPGTRTVHVALLGDPSHSLEHRVKRAHAHFTPTPMDTVLVGHGCKEAHQDPRKLSAMTGYGALDVIPTAPHHLQSPESPPQLPDLVEKLLERARVKPTPGQ